MSTTAKVLATLITLAALVAVGISSYLVWDSVSGAEVASCGAEGFDCQDVLASSWSRWLGVPVALLGGVVYAAIAAVVWPAALSPRGMAMNALLALSLMAIGAAVWFVGLQLFQIQSLCLFCLTVHACGLAITCMTAGLYVGTRGGQVEVVASASSIPGIVATRDASSSPLHTSASLIVGALGVAVLAIGQIVLPTDTSKAMQEVELNVVGRAEQPDTEAADEAPDFMQNAPTEEDAAPSTPAGPPHRLLSFAALPSPVDIDVEPVLGRADATYVIVEMMDYACSHCRQLQPRLKAARERYGDQFAVIIRPVPLADGCNNHLPEGRRGRKHACDYSQLAMAVWELEPRKFAEFHDWLLEGRNPPTIAQARKRALNLVGDRVILDKKLKSQITERLRQHSDEWHPLNSGLPLLLFSDSAITGGGKSNEELFRTLESKLGMQPPAQTE